MSKDMHTVAGIPDEEFVEALHEIDGRTEDARTEYAAVYYRRGRPVAEGPFEERRLAEVRQRAKGGVIAERTVVTDFGLWTESPEPAEKR
jgi:hypothetical protein